MFAIPWKNLIALKAAVENQPSTRLRAVIPFSRPVSNLKEVDESHEKVGGHVKHKGSEKQGNHENEVGGCKEKGRVVKEGSRKEKGSQRGQRSCKGHLLQVFQNPTAEPV